MWILLGKFLVSKVSGWIAIILLIAGISWAVYVTAIRPHTKPNATTSEKAETIIHNNYNCKALIGWGCNGCNKK